MPRSHWTTKATPVLAALLVIFTAGGALAGEIEDGVDSASDAAASTNGSAPTTDQEVHRYLVLRTFPEGALDGLDDVAKQQINATNAASNVRWLRSYANADLTKTYCVYEGPSEDAILEAAQANGIPVDEVIEIPVDLSPRRSY